MTENSSKAIIESALNRLRAAFMVFFVLLLAAAPSMALSRVQAASTQRAAHRQAYPGPKEYQPYMDLAQSGDGYRSERSDAQYAMHAQGENKEVLLACYSKEQFKELTGPGADPPTLRTEADPTVGEASTVVCLIERTLIPGETLSDVAALAGFPLQTLLELNPQYGDNPDLVPEDAMLTVPVRLQVLGNNRAVPYPEKSMPAMGTEQQYVQCSASGGGAQVCVVEYTVQPGDSLTEIAARYGISIKELIEFNTQYLELEPVTEGHPGYRAPEDKIRFGRFVVSNILSVGARLLIPLAGPAVADGADQLISSSRDDDEPSDSSGVPLAELQLERTLPDDLGEGEVVYPEGDALEYSYTVTNVGIVPVTDLTLINARLELTCDLTQLGPGDSTNCSGQDTISAEDIDRGRIVHTFEAKAEEVDGVNTVSATDAFTISLGTSEETTDPEQQPDGVPTEETPSEGQPPETTEGASGQSTQSP